MVCQNQSIDDSDAPLARDLRLLVRERLKAGDSDTQVLDFLTARYGQFVLLKPRFGWDTALLWLAPAGVLLAGVWGLVALLRRRWASPLGGADVEPPGLTAAERGRLAQLLANGGQSTDRSS
jgi:cytochrome c-type biogenesis protein CcmH